MKLRKWLTNPVRKLSHGKLDKPIVESPKPSSKRTITPSKWKLLGSHEDMGNKPTSPGLASPSLDDASEEGPKLSGKLAKTQKATSLDVNGDEEEGCDVELPPPMQIQARSFPGVPSQDKLQNKRSSSLSFKPSERSTLSTDLATEIEQIVKQRLEHHESVPEGSFKTNEMESNSDPEGSLPLSPDDDDKPLSPISQQLSHDENASPGSLTEEEESDQATSDSEQSQQNLMKRMYVIQELVDTERDYVRDLGCIIEGYMELMKDKDGEIPMPEPLRNGKDKMVFGNLEQIYEWHRDTFLLELEKCIEDPARLGLLFRRYERKLHMYVVYCQNKPMSEYIVSEYIDNYFEELRQKIGHKLQLPDLLIKPVQRIMRYQLMLKDIHKYTERAGLKEEALNLQTALEIMHVVPKAANDMMSVGRLQGFDGKIAAQGKLLLQDVMTTYEGASALNVKGKELQVFLFEQIIIFSDIIGKKTQFSYPVYKYKVHIQVNKMALEDLADDGDPLKFVLKSKCPLQPRLAVVLQCSSQEVHDIWVSEIRASLDSQLNFLRAIQSPIAYQKELTKEISAPELGSLWNPMLRKTLSHPPTPSSMRSKANEDGGGEIVKQRRSAREKKAKNIEGAGERRLTVSCTTTSPKQEAAISKMASLPCSPTEKLTEEEVDVMVCPAPVAANGKADQRKHSLPLEKRSGTQTQSPPKTKKHFFEGFRNTLRSKSKTDGNTGTNQGNLPTGSGAGSPSSDNSREFRGPATRADSADGGRSTSWWSTEGGGSPKTIHAMVSPMVAMKAVVDFKAENSDELGLRKNEVVLVVSVDLLTNNYLVQRRAMDGVITGAGFVPAPVLAPIKCIENDGKKAWSFKFRKLSFKKDSKEGPVIGCLANGMGTLPETRVPNLITKVARESREILTRVNVHEGDRAELMCEFRDLNCVQVVWLGPDQTELTGRNEFVTTYINEVASLTIASCYLSDSGVYTCIGYLDDCNAVHRMVILNVVGKPSCPGKPKVVGQTGSSVYLEWEPPPSTGSLPVTAYTIELSEQGLDDVWQLAVAFCPSCSQVVEDLASGQTYRFRVNANNEVGISDPGPPSDPVTIPDIEERPTMHLEETMVFWKTGYDKDFVELGELGRGRFSVVNRCHMKASGIEVAIKLINKKRQQVEDVQHEFLTLQGLQHVGLVHALDTYQTPRAYVLVLQLVFGLRLLDFITEKVHYDEAIIVVYIRQLLDVVRYLHNCRIAHLDIKPENCMIELGHISPQLKLVDFGDARNISSDFYVHPLLGSPEFAAPELVSGQPVSLLSDMWSVGVMLYVCLSGVSPFLDDSIEETCSNILRNDFSFPEEHFGDISLSAKALVSALLVTEPNKRLTAQQCLCSEWIIECDSSQPMDTARLKFFMERRKHQNDYKRVLPLVCL